MSEIENKTPIILLHKSSVPAFSVFNPNDWDGKSKQIIDLCAINYGLLLYTSKIIIIFLKMLTFYAHPV